MQQLSIFSSAELRVSPSRSPDSARASMIRAVNSCSSILQLLADIGPVGWSGRTSPASSRRIADGRLAPSSLGWQTSGMGSPSAFLTLNISDWPSDGSACSLSAILETGAVPLRYYLSPRACRGILRRAEQREKTIPDRLRAALEAVASTPEPFVLT